MESDEHKEFDRAVSKLFRDISAALPNFWPNAKDKYYASQERAQIISAGLVTYDIGPNRTYIQYFDKKYKLGESISESIATITAQASEEDISYVPDGQDETEYLTRFRQVIPTVILSNRHNILGLNVNEINDTAVTRTFFIELYALRKLIDLYQEKREPVKVIEQMEWLGTQKELAELHIELEAKGWVKKSLVKTVKAAYTKSDTIHQVMKRNESARYGDTEYDQVFTPKYKPMFYGIKQNSMKEEK